MRRYLLPVAIVLVIILSAVIPVLAASYTATISVTENGTASYTMTGIVIPADNDWMADNGFFNSTANDTRVETVGGTKYPHMVADNATYTASAIPQGSQTNLYFTTGNSELDDFYIIPGNGGYVTVTDDSTMEPGDNFTLTLTDTFIGLDGNLISKVGALNCYSETNNITFHIYTNSWESPTGHTDPGSQWSSETNAYDDNTSTYAEDSVAASSWSAYIQFDITEQYINSAEIWASRQGNYDQLKAEVDFYVDGEWVNIGQEDITASGYVYFYSEKIYFTNEIRVRLYNGYSGGSQPMELREVNISPALFVTDTTTLIGNDVEISADSTNLTLSIDGVAEDTVALNGASVPDNASDWVIGGSAVPYIGGFNLAVDGVDVCTLDPTSIIVGTVLPDNSGSNNPGAFTFGTNPSGLTVSLGSLTSGDQPTPAASTGDTTPMDILPPSQVDPSGDINTATLQSSILYDILMIGPLSDLSRFSEAQLWRLYGFMFVLLATAGTALMVRSHLVISGIACIGSMWYMYHLTIFPWWSLIISGVIFVTTLIMERQPSV